MAKKKTPRSDAYVYSTLANDQRYRSYRPGGADLQVPAGEGIFIKGGAHLADFTGLVTPQGVVTGVTNEELAELKTNEMFLLHEKNGFILVSAVLDDPDDVADDMEARDKSAPLTPEALAPSEPQPAAPAGNPRKA